LTCKVVRPRRRWAGSRWRSWRRPVLYGECLAEPCTGTTFCTSPAMPALPIRGWWRTGPSASLTRRSRSGWPRPLLFGHLPPVQAPGLEPDCEDYGQAVAYRETLPRHSGAWSLDKHHCFPTGKVAAVCGNTQRMLAETRLRPHFDFFGGAGGTSASSMAAVAACPSQRRKATRRSPEPAVERDSSRLM